MKALISVRAVVDFEGNAIPLSGRAGPVAWVAGPETDQAICLATSLASGASVAVSVAPPALAEAALRRALALGATGAFSIWDEGLEDADVPVVAHVLAGVTRSQGADLLVFGVCSADVGTGALPGYAAGLLGWPCVDGVVACDFVDGALHAVRHERSYREIVAVSPPAVLVAAPDGVTVPYPTLASRLRAQRTPLPGYSLSDVVAGETQLTRPGVGMLRTTLPKPACAVSLTASHPSPEMRAAMALTGFAAPRAGPRPATEGIQAALRLLEDLRLLTKGE